jgi:Ulp1 family protease
MQTYAAQKIESHSENSTSSEDIKKYIERGFGKSDKAVSYNWAVGILNVGKHWVTLVVDFLNEMLYEMDSLCQAKTDGNGYGRELTYKFSVVLNEVYGKSFTVKVKPVHQQKNGYDCGILALMNAESFVKIIADGKNFDQEDISADNDAETYRVNMVELYNAQKIVQK